ncbi:hypothetical protein [Clostridium oryzae]|uniref:CAAX amino terminal protease self-immunity n=1 Tax=Clostridium oryzae TaxID=1450648 RepID=A0A1V4IXY1_9CLOT|nr:hypothetical protein [Clostridium oryzae]OPJ64901.1 hypothetical protein CLORY_04100 [Clostridium oryzae]
MKGVSKFSFLFLALLSWIVIQLDPLISNIISSIVGESSSNFSFTIDSINFILVILVWAISAYYLFSLSKSKLDFNILKTNEKPTKINLFIALLLLASAIIVTTALWNFKLKPVAEFSMHIKSFGTLGIISFILQYIYYVFEIVLATLIISFGQKFGDLMFKSSKIPWGGILLAITWGLIHIVWKGSIVFGCFIALDGILFGTIYLLVKKNIYYAFPIIFLMFVF